MGPTVVAYRMIFFFIEIMPITFKMINSLRRRRPYEVAKAALEEATHIDAFRLVDRHLYDASHEVSNRSYERRAWRESVVGVPEPLVTNRRPAPRRTERSRTPRQPSQRSRDTTDPSTTTRTWMSETWMSEHEDDEDLDDEDRDGRDRDAAYAAAHSDGDAHTGRAADLPGQHVPGLQIHPGVSLAIRRIGKDPGNPAATVN